MIYEVSNLTVIKNTKVYTTPTKQSFQIKMKYSQLVHTSEIKLTLLKGDSNLLHFYTHNKNLESVNDLINLSNLFHKITLSMGLFLCYRYSMSVLL